MEMCIRDRLRAGEDLEQPFMDVIRRNGKEGYYGRSKPQFKVTLWYGSIYYKFDYGTT